MPRTKTTAWRPSAQQEQVQPCAVYDRLSNEIHTEMLRMHRLADEHLQTRLSAFDTRAAQRLKYDLDMLSEEGDENWAKVKSSKEQDAQDHAGLEETQGMITVNAEGVEVVDQEVQVDFKVVRWSSEKHRHPAIALTQPRGFWEAAPMKIKNQFVVLELTEPCRVTGIEFGLPGNDSGPRQCRLFFSKRSAEGPWMEAWRFEVPSKTASTFKSTHDYSSGSMSEQFVHLCASAYGTIDEAWDQILDVNGDGKLSYMEFVSACNRVRKLSDSKDMHFLNELSDLFADLDLDDSGEVTIEDLRARLFTTHTPEAVRARYWKLMIRSNFGSIKRLQMAGPLKLQTTIKVPATVIGRMRMEGMTLYPSADQRPEQEDKVHAFSLEALHVSGEAVMLRRLCEKHNLHSLDIEELYRSFRSSNGNKDVLREKEFGEAVHKIYGAGDGDIPAGRVRAFWVSADQSRDGAVDFEEFLVWARTHAEDIKLKSMRSRTRGLQLQRKQH